MATSVCRFNDLLMLFMYNTYNDTNTSKFLSWDKKHCIGNIIITYKSLT